MPVMTSSYLFLVTVKVPDDKRAHTETLDPVQRIGSVFNGSMFITLLPLFSVQGPSPPSTDSVATPLGGVIMMFYHCRKRIVSCLGRGQKDLDLANIVEQNLGEPDV